MNNTTEITIDDEMINSLGSVDPHTGEPVRRLLAAWRHEVHSAPISDTPSTDDALRAIREGRSLHRAGSRSSLRLLIAMIIVAVVALTLSGIGASL